MTDNFTRNTEKKLFLQWESKLKVSSVVTIFFFWSVSSRALNGIITVIMSINKREKKNEITFNFGNECEGSISKNCTQLSNNNNFYFVWTLVSMVFLHHLLPSI